MHPFLQKTLGGLTAAYYFRQLFFGALIAAFVYYITTRGGLSLPASLLIYIVLSTLLYPYARFVYESIVNFFMGDNVFFVNGFLMLVVKFFTMVVCWSCAIFIAPVGLAYLYYHHSKPVP